MCSVGGVNLGTTPAATPGGFNLGRTPTTQTTGFPLGGVPAAATGGAATSASTQQQVELEELKYTSRN
jgi:hypothetical protein